MTTSRLSCPYPCAGSYCPYIRSDAECISCEHRPELDAYYQRCAAAAEQPVSSPYDRTLNAWQRLQQEAIR